MFHNYQIKFAIVLTICMLYSTKAKNNCQRICGESSLKYPFGFSTGCEIKLNCTESKRVQIGELQVQNVTSDSIFISLPAKCNRRTSFIDPLFGNNFAPTWNNSFLVQSCPSKLGGCVIPTSSFMGNLVLEGCDRRTSSDDNINCLTRMKEKDVVIMTHEDWNKTRCKFLFSAIAVDEGKELRLQFQVVELGWWLEGTCHCSDNATCTQVNLAGEKQGFRCHCHEGLTGDGFMNGTGCRRVGV